MMSGQVRRFLERVSARSPIDLEPARRVNRSIRTWWNHRRTQGYMVSYPGCGRTWLTVLVGKALIDEFRLDGANPAAITDLADVRRGVPRIEVIHDDRPQLCRPEEMVRDKDRFARKSVVLLVRDPRDAIISYYFEASKRRGRFEGTPGEFLRHPVGGLDSLLTYYNVWAESRSVPRRFYRVSYEELHRDPVGELARVMNAFGSSPPRSILEGAVAFARFENMRKMEAKGFARPELDRRDPGDAESFKVRKGRVGGYREYLSEEEIGYLNERIAERLSPYYADYLSA